jgi:hypothetical protein
MSRESPPPTFYPEATGHNAIARRPALTTYTAQRMRWETGQDKVSVLAAQRAPQAETVDVALTDATAAILRVGHGFAVMSRYAPWDEVVLLGLVFT